MKKIRLKSAAAKFLANGRAISSQDQFTYMLRSCDKDMSAYGGFVWPRFGAVDCSDWSPSKACGNGLHGLLMGQGDIRLTAKNDIHAQWLVCAVWAADVIELNGKVKVPRAWVAFTGSRADAVSHMQSLGANACAWGTATAGYAGTATAGDYGTATAGDYGTATAGYAGTATAGYAGTATAGVRGTATAGVRGTATAGYAGEIRIRWYDGRRYRLAVGYVGENGVEQNVAYRVLDGILIKK